MADKIFNDYQGASIKIGGVCYKFDGETTSAVNADPSEVESVYASCLACETEVSSSSSSEVEAPPAPKTASGCAGNSDPRIMVTVCWTGAPSTYSWLGQTWDNGDSYIICPSNYGDPVTYEYWQYPGNTVPGTAGDTIYLRAVFFSPSYQFRLNVLRKGSIYYKFGPGTAFVSSGGTSNEFWLRQGQDKFPALQSKNYNVDAVGNTVNAFGASGADIKSAQFQPG